MRDDEAIVGIRCDSCSFSGVILSNLKDEDCPECEPGMLEETSVLAADD